MDFSIANMVLNGMIPYRNMLCLWVVDRVTSSDFDDPLIILVNGSRRVQQNINQLISLRKSL